MTEHPARPPIFSTTFTRVGLAIWMIAFPVSCTCQLSSKVPNCAAVAAGFDPHPVNAGRQHSQSQPRSPPSRHRPHSTGRRPPEFRGPGAAEIATAFRWRLLLGPEAPGWYSTVVPLPACRYRIRYHAGMGLTSGQAIVRAREMAGISRRELARRVHTSPSALLRYERGEMVPSVDTLERILGGAFIHRRRWSSLGGLASAIAHQLESGNKEWAWRISTEVIDDEHAGNSEETGLFVSRYPDLTGNSWADAMVAALGEWICVKRGIATPVWTLETRVASPFWFVNTLPTFRNLAISESPPSFASRGIFLTRKDLTTA